MGRRRREQQHRREEVPPGGDPRDRFRLDGMEPEDRRPRRRGEVPEAEGHPRSEDEARGDPVEERRGEVHPPGPGPEEGAVEGERERAEGPPHPRLRAVHGRGPRIEGPPRGGSDLLDPRVPLHEAVVVVGEAVAPRGQEERGGRRQGHEEEEGEGPAGPVHTEIPLEP